MIASPGPIADLKQRVVARAKELGFDAVGIARADRPLGVEHERYVQFVQDGKHGAMDYLSRDVEARRAIDGEAILPGAKSVICLARRYQRASAREEADPPVARLVARYARGHDYHNHLRKKVRALARFVRSLAAGVAARPLCDEEPVLERAWAARAGLGFVGKNGLLIVPGQGSMVLLGEVVTTLELAPDDPMAERCGSCRRCLDACPTGAFSAPFVLDPRRCIAYFTIEDPLGPRAAGLAIGEHLFGCDECQTACPYNRTEAPGATRTRPFEPLAAFEGLGLEKLVTFDQAAFEAFAIGSPLRRATRVGLARSAVQVAASRLASRSGGEREAEARRVLERALTHDHEIVRQEAGAALAESTETGDGQRETGDGKQEISDGE